MEVRIMMRFHIKEQAKGNTYKNAGEIYHSIKDLAKADQESFWVLGFRFCRGGHREILRECAFLGKTNEVNTDSKIIFKRLIHAGALAWIALHNHTSGCRDPSKNDKAHALKLLDISKMLDINLLDYIIIADATYFSFYEEGLFSVKEKSNGERVTALEMELKKLKTRTKRRDSFGRRQVSDGNSPVP
jgi:DNA repair protein RadC